MKGSSARRKTAPCSWMKSPRCPSTRRASCCASYRTKRYAPSAGKSCYKTNCRIVAATNRVTEEAIKDGKLREDLFYRISAISVHLPSLRERRDDIMPLAVSFLKRFAAQASRTISGFTPLAVERLSNFDWPGNVRQLQNEVQRAVLLCEGKEVDASDLSISVARAGGGESGGPPASRCWKGSSATPSSPCSRKPAGTSSKPPNASASAAKRSITRSRPTASRFRSLIHEQPPTSRPGANMNRAVFLDRDGTIIEEKHYLHRPEQVVIFPGAGSALARLQKAGFKLFIVSNQSGVGRGYFTEADVLRGARAPLPRIGP